MNRGKSSHIPEFKGIYYNDSKEQNCFEGGAHFKYRDLYLILEKLKQTYPYNSNEKGIAYSKNKNAFINDVTNGNKNEPKTRNTQSIMEKSNTKQQLTSYTNKVNHNFFHQYIQPKYMGASAYNNNTKAKTKNKVIIPKPNKASLNQPQSKLSYAKRNQSEDPQKSNNNKTPKSSRMHSNTQKVIDYSNKVKQKNLISTRVNFTRNGNKTNNINSNNNNHNNDDNTTHSHNFNNGNQHTFAFSNGNTKQVKSRNCNRMTGNDLFDNNNHSFYTKSECRRKDKKEMNSIRYTMDKETMFNKTVMTKKVCCSITISKNSFNSHLDKCIKKNLKDKTNQQNINGSIDIDSHKGKKKKSFLS